MQPTANTQPTYVVFGPRVSDATKAAIRSDLGAQEIPVDFGPFGSGAPFCELFPLPKAERKGMTTEQLAARYKDKLAMLNGAHILFIESTGEQPGVAESIERVRFAVNSFKKYGAAEITLAMPNVAYERQDRDFSEQGRLCSLGSKWLATDLKRYGADRIITFAPHSQANIHDWQQVFGEGNYHPLQTTQLFAEDIRTQFPDAQNLVIGAPDGADKPNDRGIARAQELAAVVRENLPMFKIGKAHVDASETAVTSFEGDVAGKDCVVIDDMSDGGSTLINAAKELKERGAKSVSVYFTHAICSDKIPGATNPFIAKLADFTEIAGSTVASIASSIAPAFFEKWLALKPDMEKFRDGSSLKKLASNPHIDRIVTTDTVPEIIAKRAALVPELQDKISILSVGPLLAAELQHICAQQPGTSTEGPLNAVTAAPEKAL